jgi:CRISPR/Cas system-associated protein endoribonuclease Cas2
MADTDIDAVKKRKNAERIKQYRLKRKFLMQQQASTSSETRIVVMRIVYIFERITSISLA